MVTAMVNGNSTAQPFPPATLTPTLDSIPTAVLELADGTSYRGYSFGAKKSVAGEMVFQTGKEEVADM